MLSDPKKRAVYDQFGEEGLKCGVPEGSGQAGAWNWGYTFHGNAEKVFRDFMGSENPFQGKADLFARVTTKDILRVIPHSPQSTSIVSTAIFTWGLAVCTTAA